MKGTRVIFLKDHGEIKKGEDVHIANEGLANYLIRVGVAAVKEVVHFEKEEIAPKKEKKENKTGNVPTAKKKKK